MIQSRLAVTFPRAGDRTKPATSAQQSLSRTVEHWFVVATFVLMGVSVWFTGAEGDADVMRGSTLAQILWGSVYLGAIIALWRNRDRLPELMRLSLPIIVIVALSAISTLWSTDPSITLKRAVGLCGTTAFGYYVVSRFRLQEFVDILGVTCWVVIVLSLLAVIFLPSVGTMQSVYAGAWRGIFNHKNTFGEFMALALLTFASLGLSRAWRRRVVATGLPLAAILIIQSQSATAWLVSLLLSFGLGLAVLYKRGPRGRMLALTIGAAAFLTLIWVLLFGNGGQAVLTLLGRDESLTGRVDIWPEVTQAISYRPLLGYGYSAFWLPDGDFSYFVHSGSIPAHAHNGYLEACLDIGILGSALAALAILIGLRRAVALLRKGFAHDHAWPLLTVIYFIGVNLTESSIAKYNNFNWIVFVIAFLYASRHEKDPLPGAQQQISDAAS